MGGSGLLNPNPEPRTRNSNSEPGTRNPEPYCPPALGGGGDGMSDGANRGSIWSRIDR